eukprot:20794-Heterococcus_DN1.PRE.1
MQLAQHFQYLCIASPTSSVLQCKGAIFVKAIYFVGAEGAIQLLPLTADQGDEQVVPESEVVEDTMQDPRLLQRVALFKCYALL